MVGYAWHGRHLTRHAATQAVVHRLSVLGCKCFSKPVFRVGLHPQRAMRQCMQWAANMGVPCDGVVFADNTVTGYGTTGRLWKVKYMPTVDFAVHRAFDDIFELMLRTGRNVMQSLHRFRDNRFEYILPVLLQAPPDVKLQDGDVVEVALEVVRMETTNTAFVTFPSMHVREAGKTPNFLIGGMDLAANGMTVNHFLRQGCSVLMRVLLGGPVRRMRNCFLKECLGHIHPSYVLEIGGGCGGDVAMWSGATAVEIIDVVEPDTSAIDEYKRRLCHAFHGTEHKQTVVLPDGRRFRFHATEIFSLPTHVARRGCDLAVLYFCISQIVGNDTDMDALLGGLFKSRGIKHVVVAAHDHVAIGLPNEDDHVMCQMIRSSGCSDHPMLCTCEHGNGKTARLLTKVEGSRMANGIEENVFSVDRFLDRVQCYSQRAGNHGLHHRVWWPYKEVESAHWLLRTMAFVHLTSLS